jgi:hypothetical protein
MADDMDDLDRDVFRVRKRDNSPAQGGERLVGYLVPMVICAVLCGAAVGIWRGQGGGLGRRHHAERALNVTSGDVKGWALAGALFGAIIGAAVARKSELTGGRSLK